MKPLKPINSEQYQAQLRHAGAVMQRYHAKIIAAGCMVHGDMVYIPKCFEPGTLERMWDEAVAEEAATNASR